MNFAGLICANLKIMVLLVFLPDWPRVGYIMNRWWMDSEGGFLVWGVVVIYVGAVLPLEADSSLFGDSNGPLRIHHNREF